MSAEVSSKPGRNPLAQAAKADRNRKILIQVAVAVVLLGLIAGIGIALATRKHNDDKAAEGSNTFHWNAEQAALVPPNLTPEGAIRIDNAAAPAPAGKQKVSVRVVADMQCPACDMFEKSNADALKKAVQSGQAVVDYNITPSWTEPPTAISSPPAGPRPPTSCTRPTRRSSRAGWPPCTRSSPRRAATA
nr:hypothetical protein [Nocardia tengchongensis]